jgi:tetratricopeptide (TPR) repeat protein
MDRLEHDLKQIMQVASVIGKDFGFRVLQTITGMREELKSHLLSLQGLEFIYEKRILPELEYIFKHALIQEVAYNSLLLKKRKEIHENVANALEQIYPERLEEFYEMLAHHFSKGKDSEKAYQYLKLSGEKAARSHSLWEAFHYYREAINVLDRLPATEQNKREQIEVRLLLSTPMVLLGHPEDSLQILQEGESLSQEIGDERNLLIFQSKLGSYYALHEETLLAIEYTENSFQEAERIKDIELMAPIACELCASYFVVGRFLQIVDVAPKVHVLLEKTKREHEFFGTRYNVYSGLCAYCAYASGGLGSFKEGRALFEKGRHFALEARSLYGLGWLEFCYGFLLLVLGDGKGVVDHMEKSIAYYEEAQVLNHLGMARAILGYGHYLMGELETAREYIEKGLKDHNDMNLAYWLSFQSTLLSMVYFDLGDLTNAQDHLERAIKLAENNNEKHFEGISKIHLGRMVGKAKRSTDEVGEECVLEGIKILDELKLRPWSTQGYLCLGELYAERGQREKALENLKKAESSFQSMEMAYWLSKTREVTGKL